MKKISSMEYNSLVWFVIRAGYLGISLSNLITISQRDSWLSGIIAMILGLVPLGIFVYLRNYSDNMNICDLNEHIFGKFGKFLNLFLLIGVFMFVQIAFLDMVRFINSQFLYSTSSILISLVFIVPLIYGLFKGLNAISRTSLIMFYLIIFTIIFIILGVINGVDINNLKPAFLTSPGDIMHGAIILIAYNILPLFFLLIIPKAKIENYKPKRTLIFYVLAILSLINAVFLTIGSFGMGLSLLFEYPEFHLLKKLSIGEFIDRLESLLSMEWIIALFILIMIGLYFITTTIKQTFKLNVKTNKVVILLTCLLLLIINPLVFQTNNSLDVFLRGPMLIIMFFFFFILPIWMIIGCKLKRIHDKNSRRNQNDNNQNDK